MMKKLLALTLITFSIAWTTLAQQSGEKMAVKYVQTELQSKPSVVGENNFNMYAAGRYQIFIEKEKQRILIKSMGKDILKWSAKESNEYTKFEPHFFIPDYKNFPILLMVEEIVDGSSNGQHVILMDKGKAFYCGFLNLAADKGDGTSISKYASVEMKSGSIFITFANDANLFCWENYDVYKGKDVSFAIELKDAKDGLKPTPNSAFKTIGNAGKYPLPEEKIEKDTGKQPQKDNFTW